MLQPLRYVFIGFIFLTVLTGAERPRAGNDRPVVVAGPDSAAVEMFGHARLLASFGESRRAYQLTPGLDTRPSFDPDQISFEVRLLTELGLYETADSVLSLWAPLGDEDEVFRYALRRGKLNLFLGRYERALDCLAEADSLHNPSLAPYRELIRLEAHLGLERAEAAIRVGERIIRHEPPEALSPELELALIRAYTLDSRPLDALDVLDRLQRRAGRAAEKAVLVRIRYDLYVQADDMEGARSAAKKLARSYRRYGEAEHVSIDVAARVGRKNLSSNELLAHTGVMIAHSRFKDAKKLLAVLDERRLNESQREERLIVKARFYYSAGDYRTATALAKPRFQTPAYRRESILIVARSNRRTGKKREAADLYRYFAKSFPNDGKAAEALHVAAILYESTGINSKAQETLALLRKSYPSSYYGRLSAYRSAQYFNLIGRHKSSLAILDRAVRRSRRTDEAALYYLADTYSKLGEEDQSQLIMNELRELNSRSFYVNPNVEPVFRRPLTTSTGKVALDGDDGLLVFLSEVVSKKNQARRTLQRALAGGKQGDHGSNVSGAAGACLARGRWFLDAGFREWADRELDTARRQCFDSPAELLDLGQVYDDYGMPWQSIRLYQRVKDSIHWKKRAEFSEEFRNLMYPVPYPIQVLENASSYDLPPHLVYAMIREESHFDRNAISRVGAVGLMQLMPETGRYVARELELPQWGEDSLFDPEINLAFGIWYASSLTEATGGNHTKMLAAYNAGLGNAKRWFSSAGKQTNPISVVDGIDYRETRLYVQRIIESANVYHDLYFDTDELD